MTLEHNKFWLHLLFSYLLLDSLIILIIIICLYFIFDELVK